MPNPTSTGRKLRRDAQLRRDALLEAAAEAFAEQGYHVPLEAVAERAGVGRATLYRNFPDRMALVYAIFAREVERLDVGVGVDPDEPLAQVLMRFALAGRQAHALFARLAGDLPLQGKDLAAFQLLGIRFAEMIQPAAAAARARGDLRAGVGGRELALALRMIGGLLSPFMTEKGCRETVCEAVALILAGLAPRPADAPPGQDP